MRLNHITIVHPSLHLIGGAERLMTDFATGLADKETTVEVVTGQCHSIWRNELSLKKERISLKELGKIAPGNLQFWLNVKGYAKSLAKLISPDTDLVIASRFPAALAATFYPRRKSVKVVHYLHDVMVLHEREGLQTLPRRLRAFYRLMSWRYAKADAEAVRACDLIIANSLLSRRINAELFNMTESAMEVVYPCVNAEVVAVSSRVPDIISEYVTGRKPIIFVPRGTQFWRRPILCLQALKALKVEDFIAVFTGGTDYEVAALLKQAKKLGISRKILCVQELPDEDLNALYSHSTVVVSIPKWQPFGMVPLEALVCGAPSVIFDSSGVSEVLRNGVDVLCVPDGNLQQLTSAIETLILDPEFRRKIVSSGQRKVLQEFTLERFVGEFREKLAKLGDS